MHCRLMLWLSLLSAFSFSPVRADSPEPLTVQPAVKQVVLSGYTRSRTTMALASEVPGRVLRVNYEIGQASGSEPFLEIDSTFVNFEIEQLECDLDKLRLAQDRAESRATYLEKEFRRIDELFRTDAAPAVRRDAAAEELTQARLERGATAVEIRKLQTHLKELRERRERHKLFIPRGWVLVQRRVEPGEIIAAGTPVGQAADFTCLVVPLFVSAGELTAVEQQGASNRLELLVAGSKVRAALHWVNPEFDERSRKHSIELIFQAGQAGQADVGPRRGGLPADLPLRVPAEGIMIARAAVINRNDNPRVVIEPGGRSVPVTILNDAGDYLIVAETPDLSVGTLLRSMPSSP